MADFAELNVRRCRYSHDCHNTPQMLNSGQNINYESGFGSEYEPIHLFIEDTINYWWDEKDLSKQSNINQCCGTSQISHFLQMASDRTNQVGCAIAQFTEGEEKKTYIACNYSIGIQINQVIFASGVSASQCTSGRHAKYVFLCNTNEPIHFNT